MKENKSPPQIYRDRRGEIWITAEGLRRYLLISIPEGKKYFYNYKNFGGDRDEGRNN